MESSEDDAGSATNASRRTAAREMDIEQMETAGVSDGQQERTDKRSCTTPALSEDNYDDDSVPSPTSQDVNTSTEAILDMIDEYIDGPDAPKRRSREPPEDPGPPYPTSEASNTPDNAEKCNNLFHQLPIESSSETSHPNPEILAPPAQSAESETQQPCSTELEQQTDNASNVDSDITSESVETLQPSSIVAEPMVDALSVVQDQQPEPSVEPEIPAPCTESFQEVKTTLSVDTNVPVPTVEIVQEPPVGVELEQPTPSIECVMDSSDGIPILPSSSISDTRDSSEYQVQERTIKCVTSSENNENVTVESAESTSSDNSISAPVTRSPLKRRLVRPVRPDTTVSSTTVSSDSQRNITHEPVTSESIAKDVSSSSDAVSMLACTATSSQTSTTCVVSVCKAETSVSTPKKIKLIRNKITASPLVTHSMLKPHLQAEYCQSTSSLPEPSNVVTPSSALFECSSESSNSVNCTNVLHTTTDKNIEENVKESTSQEPFTSNDNIIENSAKPEEITQSPNEIVTKEESPVKSLETAIELRKDPPIKLSCSASEKQSEDIQCVSQHNASSDVISDSSESAKQESTEQKRVPPIKLCLSSSSSVEKQSEDVQTTTPQNENSANVLDSSETEIQEKCLKQRRVPPIKLNISCKSSIEKQSENIQMLSQQDVTPDSVSDGSETDRQDKCTEQRRVPPIKLSLSNSSSSEQSKDVSTIHENKSYDVTPESSISVKENTSLESTKQRKVPPIKLNLSSACLSDQSYVEKHAEDAQNTSQQNDSLEMTLQISETVKQVPKLTIKIGGKQSNEEMKSPVPKLTIKPLRPPVEENTPKLESNEQIPSITKLNIKPILKPPEKINDVHRKSSSSEISESECSENDETSTSDQASTSDQGSTDVVPKVTIKLGKPGTESEGKFYTEKNVPKLTIKTLLNEECKEDESVSKIKLKVTQTNEGQYEKIPKLTIKPVTKAENQPLSPKLSVKPIKTSDHQSKELTVEHCEIPKLKITHESLSPKEVKENSHIPKITIKPVTKPHSEIGIKTSKKVPVKSDEHDNIPTVTKLNIKPIPKPTESTDEKSDCSEDKVPVVSKLYIKPLIKPKDNEVDSSIEDIPTVTKLNIKPIRNPDENDLKVKDCDEWNPCGDEKHIPVVTKLNIKPLVKPVEEDTIKDSGNQSSETGNSSDDNSDQIPVITKLNIKPIVRPTDSVDFIPLKANTSKEENIPIVTKLNIKPLVKPEENLSLSSPKKENAKSSDYKNADNVPVVTKLNIKPIVKHYDQATLSKEADESIKNPPLLMKINIKSMADSSTTESKSEHECNSIDDHKEHNNINEILVPSKINIKPITKPCTGEKTEEDLSESPETKNHTVNCQQKPSSKEDKSQDVTCNSVSHVDSKLNQNCTPESSNEPSNKTLIEVEQTMLVEPIKIIQRAKVISEHSETRNCISPADKRVESKTSAGEGILSRVLVPEKSNELIEAKKKQVLEQLSQLSQQTSAKSCILLKKLLEENSVTMTKSDIKTNSTHFFASAGKSNVPLAPENHSVVVNYAKLKNAVSVNANKTTSCIENDIHDSSNESDVVEVTQNMSQVLSKKKVNEHATKPLEINTVPVITSSGQSSPCVTSSGQDSPRIILKINKTDQGTSSELIEDTKSSENAQPAPTPESKPIENHQKVVNKKKLAIEEVTNSIMGRKLRSSRAVQEPEKSLMPKRNVGKRPPTADTSPDQINEAELSALESKRVRLGKLLMNKALTITPVMKVAKTSPPSPSVVDLSPENKPVEKTIPNSILKTENCSKNGNSKLHKILSNLQAKQMQNISRNEINCTENKKVILPEHESTNTSTGSPGVIEIIPIENSHSEMQEMLINPNPVSLLVTDEVAQDPVEVDTPKTDVEVPNSITVDTPQTDVEVPNSITESEPVTPQPKKRGRPRKKPISEEEKAALAVPALEERPTRSLRLSRDRPVVVPKRRGRGRGRGRGAKRQSETVTPSQLESVVETANRFFSEERKTEEEIDPTSSRIKLPRMTEALDKSTCATPLSSRRRNSSINESPGLKMVVDSLPQVDEVMKSPEGKGRGRGRGGRGRTPGRGVRGKRYGGGRGAQYMKETMGIYGRVCGPSTSTVQLFEEETCMMDDNATPAKPSHLLDEDSQSSVKSSTNESSKMKKSKFADLFDSNKVWTAADVKEYSWPPPESGQTDNQVMMIQEQVAMFLGVKSFKRRYPELKRRTIGGDERSYVLEMGLATEALCDLGITAVDASDVLDIMLSDYPHKYEEYRVHQRERQIAALAAAAAATAAAAAAAAAAPQKPPTEALDTEPHDEQPGKIDVRIEMKATEASKPEPPKVDPEKLRQAGSPPAQQSRTPARCAVRKQEVAAVQAGFVIYLPQERGSVELLEQAAAAVASAVEYNSRLNALRRPACVDTQTMIIHKRRGPPPAPRYHVVPPSGLYPVALLPGQYQHWYRRYTAETLRYFPLNTTLSAPPPPPSPPESCSSEQDWSDSSSGQSDRERSSGAKRKKLTKTKRSSHEAVKEEAAESLTEEPGELCRVCSLREDGNKKYTENKFLTCASCQGKLHPSCLEFGAEVVRNCREYAWQCSSCKSCCTCLQPGNEDKMLFCELCDRGYHIYCVGLTEVPTGRWHCAVCVVCRSCGSRAPGGPPGTDTGGAASEWHHHTKRGPGGHKVFSHSLCTPCQRAYRIGRYCPRCDHSFIGPKGTLQLVICKLCDRQLHQDCVRPTVQHLNVLDYTCDSCRRAGIQSRSAAVRAAPRTIATLFMAKRRFNKYAHRQYMASKLQAADPETCEPDPESCDPDEASDPLGDPLNQDGDTIDPLETSDAVKGLQMDFGD